MPPTTAAENRMELRLDNVASVRIDVARAPLTLDARTTHETELTLQDGERTRTITLTPGTSTTTLDEPSTPAKVSDPATVLVNEARNTSAGRTRFR